MVVEKQQAIREIEAGDHRYWAQAPMTQEALIEVYSDPRGNKHLRTRADADRRNNLDNLPDC